MEHGSCDDNCIGFCRLLSEPWAVEIIARGRGVDTKRRLVARFGSGRWRKMKGLATIELFDGRIIHSAEVHWYEAHGIGRREIKRKHAHEDW